MPPTLEAWDLAIEPFTARSRLYSLAPVGIGTVFVESLSGYVERLAAAHAVSVGSLVGKEISNLVNPDGIKLGLVFYAINGVGGTAKRWVQALEILTSRPDLRYLTLLPFERLFPQPFLFRRDRAWCPVCYELMITPDTVVAHKFRKRSPYHVGWPEFLFNRLRLAFVRRPSAQPKTVESRPEPPIRVGEPLDVDRRGAAGIITLNRPAALNAVTRGMVATLREALERWRDDGAIGRVIVTAAGGRAFSAGGDLRHIYEAGLAGRQSESIAFWRAAQVT